MIKPSSQINQDIINEKLKPFVDNGGNAPHKEESRSIFDTVSSNNNFHQSGFYTPQPGLREFSLYFILSETSLLSILEYES